MISIALDVMKSFLVDYEYDGRPEADVPVRVTAYHPVSEQVASIEVSFWSI